jgi:hypothetical protein
VKTLKIFLLCFIAFLATNTVNAQNSVFKQDETETICGPDQYVPCTNDYVCGELTWQAMYTNHGIIYKLKNGSIRGYANPDGTVFSGNVYEVTEKWCGDYIGTSVTHLLLFRLNGKLIAEVHVSWHQNIDKDGNIKLLFEWSKINCM